MSAVAIAAIAITAPAMVVFVGTAVAPWPGSSAMRIPLTAVGGRPRATESLRDRTTVERSIVRRPREPRDLPVARHAVIAAAIDDDREQDQRAADDDEPIN